MGKYPVWLSAYLLAIAAIMEAAAGSNQAAAADLTIEVTGMSELVGLVHYGLYDKDGDFPDGRTVAGDNRPADTETVLFQVEDLPPGTYAVAVFHDENGNGEHDIKFLSIEDFAFSRNARAFFRAPSFDAAAFQVSDPQTTITIDFSK